METLLLAALGGLLGGLVLLLGELAVIRLQHRPTARFLVAFAGWKLRRRHKRSGRV